MSDSVRTTGRSSIVGSADDVWSTPMFIRGAFQLSIADGLTGTWRLRRSFDYVPPATAGAVAAAIAAASWGTVRDYIDSDGVEASDRDDAGAYYSVGVEAFTSVSGSPAATLRF